GSFHFRFLEHKQELTIEGLDEDGDVILRLIPPRPHIGSLIEMGEKRGSIGNTLFIHPRPLETGYRIELMPETSLCITPVVENPDPDADPSETYLDRTEMEQNLYGKYYFFPDLGFFGIVVNVGGLPAEYFSAQKKTIVAADKITSFLKEYGDQLRHEPCVFVDESLLNGETVDRYEAVTLDHQEFTHDLVSVGVNYDFGGFSLALKDIFEARRNRQRFIVLGNTWVDTFSREFSWIDALDEQAITADNLLTIGRAEYLRLLALHDRLEKRFPSERVKGWFESLEKLRPPTRPPSIKAMKGKLREYQKNGYGWLWFLYENGFSGLLCDDMGLGKTHQVMALMAGILHRMGDSPEKIRFLVICPTTVLSHWKDKILEYCPQLDPYVYHGTDRRFEEALDEHLL
ncbi:MAG: DEAD/DEAH box helicase, partial [Deltaproteobacteria bacterium]|nr:DEAD/DEAH box helicase [Deltaproteobacteria bacterium]